MISAAAFATLLALGALQPMPKTPVPAAECPARQVDSERGDLGDRAIFADDGSKVVVQCGDGTIRFWRTGLNSFRPIASKLLFSAAHEFGIVPRDIKCFWPPSISGAMHADPDCDVLDHDKARLSYVLSTASDIDSFVVTRHGVVHENEVPWQTGGALSSNKPASNVMFIVDGQRRPELLQKIDLKSGQATTIAVLPNPDLLFEEGEGRATGIAYSDTYKLVIVSFGGAFRIARGMTYVRAFDESGRQRWSIRGPIPNPDNESIVGDFTRLLTIEDGRYALLAKSSDRSVSQIINLKDGQVVGTVRGWPIAAARDSAICLVKDEHGVLSLVKIRATEKAAR